MRCYLNPVEMAHIIKILLASLTFNAVQAYKCFEGLIYRFCFGAWVVPTFRNFEGKGVQEDVTAREDVTVSLLNVTVKIFSKI